MIPTPRFLFLLTVLVVVGIAAAVTSLDWLWWAVLVAVLSAALIDAGACLRAALLGVERIVAGSLPVGVASEVGLRLRNHGRRSLAVRVYDHHPGSFHTDAFPRDVRLAPNHWTAFQYQVVPSERGEHRFAPVELRVRSPLGLWWRSARRAGAATVRVYPNFAAVARYALLATDNHLSHIGVRKRRRRGQGMEFHQLRDYRQGDSSRQVDWRATARLRKLISREYQDERDQNVVFLLDCGRRMRTQDDELSHFDQALNAMLLLAYVALRQGDSVGLGTFGGGGRWLTPGKGQSMLDRLLNALYDLQPTTEIPDYSQAALDLLARQRKHALIVVVTNLRDEDTGDLLSSVRLLQRRHLVLLASLREQALDRVMDADVESFDTALRLAATHDYLRERERSVDMLRANRVLSLDVAPDKLSLELVNAYLAIKAGGAL